MKNNSIEKKFEEDNANDTEVNMLCPPFSITYSTLLKKRGDN